MVSAGMTCVKYLLFCFNLLFAVSDGNMRPKRGFVASYVYVLDIWHCNFDDRICDNRRLQSLFSFYVLELSVSTYCVNYCGCCGVYHRILWMLWRGQGEPLHDYYCEFFVLLEARSLQAGLINEDMVSVNNSHCLCAKENCFVNFIIVTQVLN